MTGLIRRHRLLSLQSWEEGRYEQRLISGSQHSNFSVCLCVQRSEQKHAFFKMALNKSTTSIYIWISMLQISVAMYRTALSWFLDEIWGTLHLDKAVCLSHFTRLKPSLAIKNRSDETMQMLQTNQAFGFCPVEIHGFHLTWAAKVNLRFLRWPFWG